MPQNGPECRDKAGRELSFASGKKGSQRVGDGDRNAARSLHGDDDVRGTGDSEGATPPGCSSADIYYQTELKKSLRGSPRSAPKSDASLKRRWWARRYSCCRVLNRRFDPSFWTRITLVVIIAACLMGLALLILHVYNLTVYSKTEMLGVAFQHEVLGMVEIRMDDFTRDMADASVVLAAHMHEEGQVAALQQDAMVEGARRLAWTTFKALPQADLVAYGTGRGLVVYSRLGATNVTEEPPGQLSLAEPADPLDPFGTWLARVAPIDPTSGKQVAGIPPAIVPWAPPMDQPWYANAAHAPRGSIRWWVGPLLEERGVSMFFTSGSPLELMPAEAGWQTDAGVLTDAAGWGTMQELESDTLSAVASGNDTGAAEGVFLGVAGVSQTTSAVNRFLSVLDLRGGKLFFCLANGGAMVVANAGAISKTVSYGNLTFPVTIMANESDDIVISSAARHLRDAFPGRVGRDGAGMEPGTGEGQPSDALLAAASGLCWDDYMTTITVHGRKWYLQCHGRYYGGKGRLPMVGVLLIPRSAIMGHIDNEEHKLMRIVLLVALGIAVLGVGGVFVSTVHVRTMALSKQELEKEVEAAEGHIRGLTRQLSTMRSSLMLAGGSHVLDMRTPLETVHDLFQDISEGNLVPGPEMLERMQRLLEMDPHMPLMLQENALGRESIAGMSPLAAGGEGAGSTKVIDADTTAWLRSTVMRLPKRTPSLKVTSGANSTYRASLGEQPASLTSSPSFHTSRSSEEVSISSIIEGMSRMMEISAMEEGQAVAEPTGDRMGRRSSAESLHSRDGGDAVAQANGATRPCVGAHSAGSEHDVINPTPMDEVQLMNPHHGGGGAQQDCGSTPQHPSSLGPSMHRSSSRARAALATVGSWDFDTWALAEASRGKVILWMGLELYRRTGLAKSFNLSVDKLIRFMSKLDEGMLPNNYHNNVHIADVANSLYHLIKHSGVDAYLTRLDVLACITAALVHDFRHPGLNNDYVVKSSDTLALRYNDRTVLENYHVAEAFLLLAKPELNFLDVLDKDDFKYVRGVVIEMVLGSDLKRHFELLEAFKKRLKDKDKPFSRLSDTDRLLLMQIALKVADIGHSAKKLDIHRRWTAAITEEFYLQGDKEREAGMPVSAFMDRRTGDLPKSQLGFFSFIALPLVEAWVSKFPDSAGILDAMMSNVRYWEKERDGRNAPWAIAPAPCTTEGMAKEGPTGRGGAVPKAGGAGPSKQEGS